MKLVTDDDEEYEIELVAGKGGVWYEGTICIIATKINTKYTKTIGVIFKGKEIRIESNCFGFKTIDTGVIPDSMDFGLPK